MKQDLTQLANDVIMAKQQKERAEAALKDANEAVRKAEWALIEALREQGIDGFKAGGVSFAVYNKLVAKVADPDQLFPWLERHGYGGVIKRTVHHMTLNKVCSEVLEQDGALPAGVEARFIDVLSVRKA